MADISRLADEIADLEQDVQDVVTVVGDLRALVEELRAVIDQGPTQAQIDEFTARLDAADDTLDGVTGMSPDEEPV